jgi:trigger factor
MAAEYESPDKFIRWHYDNPKNLEEIQNMLVEEAAVSALLENADVVESPVSFKELVQPAG